MTVPAGVWVLAPESELPPAWLRTATPMFLVRIPAASLSELRLPGDESSDLLRLVARGTSRAELARALGVSSRTVDRRLATLRARLGVDTVAALAARLTEAGW